MKTDSELAQLCVDSYTGPQVFNQYVPGNITYGIIETTDEVIIAFRGSSVLKDWVIDMNAIADPFVHNVFGPVHPGFNSGMDQLSRILLAHHVNPKKKITLTGHSLGAARTAICAAYMLLLGMSGQQIRRVAFGEPKPGFLQLAKYLGPVEVRSYRNGDTYQYDPVTTMPFSFPPEEYVHQVAFTAVCAPPTPDLLTSLSTFGWHHVVLYAAGTKALK